MSDTVIAWPLYQLQRDTAHDEGVNYRCSFVSNLAESCTDSKGRVRRYLENEFYEIPSKIGNKRIDEFATKFAPFNSFVCQLQSPFSEFPTFPLCLSTPNFVLECSSILNDIKRVEDASSDSALSVMLEWFFYQKKSRPRVPVTGQERIRANYFLFSSNALKEWTLYNRTTLPN